MYGMSIMKRMGRRLRGSKGFTLLEIVLSIVVGGLLFGLGAEIMMQQADTYSFIAHRKTSIADVRFAMNKITHELLRIETADISDISSSSIDFIDENGQDATFSLAADGSSLAIYRNDDVLIPNVSDFEIEYQSGTGEVLVANSANISDVRRLKVTVTTDPVGDEGAIEVSTTVIPRSFIGYANFD